tara:strand:- start:134 stop:466 length:333 start_codon:yes stop_codon:yes gene_type:complete
MKDKPKTIFCDIDGTLCEYPYTAEMGNYDFNNKVMKPLPGTLKKLWEWDKAGHNIILTTGRKEGMRESTERQLIEVKSMMKNMQFHHNFQMINLGIILMIYFQIYQKLTI